METPILFIVFNRPETTKRVFEKIKEIKPLKLYIAADGPRKKVEGEVGKCNAVRNIVQKIDWDCEVKTLFRDRNLGCKHAVSAAIDWFFDKEKMGIILEDDCLPSKSFFFFCDELLNKYYNDERIMHINGNNYGADYSNFISSEYSYHFGRMPQVWGWATWKKSWSKYDVDLKDFNKKELFGSPYLDTIYSRQKYKIKQFEKWEQVKSNKIDTWDYQWQFSVISNNGLTIVPKKNLISNIGFGQDATHTLSKNSSKAYLKTEEIQFPLHHPSLVIPDPQIDSWYQEFMLGTPSFLKRVKNKLSSIIKS